MSLFRWEDRAGADEVNGAKGATTATAADAHGLADVATLEAF